MNEQKTLPGFGAGEHMPDTSWRDDRPAIAGWYCTRRKGQPPARFTERRFFDGKWSEPVLVGYDCDAEAIWSACFVAADQQGIEWFGLDAPSVHGYSYALMLIGDHMTVPFERAIDRLTKRLS